MAEVIVFLFLVFALVFPFLLYLFIEAETSNPTVVDRREAEREAKAQGGLRDRTETRRDRAGAERDRTRKNRTDPDERGRWTDRNEPRDGDRWDDR